MRAMKKLNDLKSSYSFQNSNAETSRLCENITSVMN